MMRSVTPLQIVLLVVGLLAFQAIVWIGILSILRRKSLKMVAALSEELAGSNERTILAPVAGSYSGATDRYSMVKGAGVAALTDRRLIFRKMIGEPLEVPLDEVTGVREDKWFVGAYRGRLNLILKLRGGTEVGFMLRDHRVWMDAVEKAIRARQ